jgi:hypothetical protein
LPGCGIFSKPKLRPGLFVIGTTQVATDTWGNTATSTPHRSLRSRPAHHPNERTNNYGLDDPTTRPAVTTPIIFHLFTLLYPDSTIVRKTACHGAILGFVMGHDLRRLFVSR